MVAGRVHCCCRIFLQLVIIAQYILVYWTYLGHTRHFSLVFNITHLPFPLCGSSHLLLCMPLSHLCYRTFRLPWHLLSCQSLRYVGCRLSRKTIHYKSGFLLFLRWMVMNWQLEKRQIYYLRYHLSGVYAVKTANILLTNTYNLLGKNGKHITY